jgi:hypothetical protein
MKGTHIIGSFPQFIFAIMREVIKYGSVTPEGNETLKDTK